MDIRILPVLSILVLALSACGSSSTSDTAVPAFSSSDSGATAADTTALAGSYRLLTEDGGVAAIEVDENGAITPAGTRCRLSGTLGQADAGGQRPLELQARDCGSLAERSEGRLVIDEEDRPASFRLVTGATSAQADAGLLAFRE